MMHATGGADKTYAFTLVTTEWHLHREALSAIRRHVFIEEQHVPESLEWDDEDEDAIHLLAFSLDGDAIGCARLLHDGRLGRMAVLPEWRGRGVGSALLAHALELLREQCFEQVMLSAQTHAIGFYELAGFRVCSEVYDDAGIPHRDMVLTL
jgi:predicted GNAT family N-acyltransferase